jgi:hypothetical protein
VNLDSLDMNALGNEGAWVDIVGPDGSKTDLRVKIRGAHSDEVRAALDRHKKRAAEAVKAAKGRAEVDWDAMDRQRDAEVSVASVIDWAGFERGGKDYPSTAENVKALLSHPGYSWLAAQVYASAQDAKVFLKP